MGQDSSEYSPSLGQFVDFVDGHISQLLNYFIGGIFPFIHYLMFGLETFLPQQDMVTLAPAGYSSSFGHTVVYDMSGLLVLHFLGQNISPTQFVPHVGLHTHGELGEAVLLFASQIVSQSLVSASAKTSNCMG